MGNGLYSSLVLYFLSVSIFSSESAFRSDGQTADMAAVGTAMFTCIIWAVNIQIALTMSHFTWIQHFFVWGSIASWYLFLLAYGTASPLISGNAFKILLEALGPAAIYWFSTLLIGVVCNLPYLVHISYQRACNPLDHHVIQEIKYYKKDLEDHDMWKRERSKARQKTKIGFTARVEAKIRYLKGRLHKKIPSITIQTVS
jgi:phospholipid-translocating ATPase